MTQRQTVLVLYAITILLGIIAFAFTVQLHQYTAMIVVVVGGCWLESLISLAAGAQVGAGIQV